MAARHGDGTVFEVAHGQRHHHHPGLVQRHQRRPIPLAGLVEDSSGNLFGTTDDGGASGDGTVFELQPGSGTITTLASFNGTNGANPEAGLIEDSSGNLFGTTDGRRRVWRRHGVRGGARQRHHHHPGLLQRHQRGQPRRPAWSRTAAAISSAPPYDGGDVERRHGVRGGSTAAARSPPWPPSTAPTAANP